MHKPLNNIINNKIVKVFLETQVLVLFCTLLFYVLTASKLSFLVPIISPVNPIIGNESTQDAPYHILILFFLLFVNTILLALLEEIVHRFIPFLLWKKLLSRWAPFWSFVVVTAAIFAITHNNNSLEFRFPLVQFIAGMYYGSLYRYRFGFGYGLFSHTLYNLSSGFYVWLLFLVV